MQFAVFTEPAFVAGPGCGKTFDGSDALHDVAGIDAGAHAELQDALFHALATADDKRFLEESGLGQGIAAALEILVGSVMIYVNNNTFCK